MCKRCFNHKKIVCTFSFVLLSILFSGCVWFGLSIKIEKFSPQGEVSRKTNFTIVFSQPLVPPESVGVWIEPTFLEIEPHIEGKCKWISQKELRFYPEEKLRPSTKYSLEILPEIVQLKDYRLTGKKSFEFYTERIRVVSYNFEYRVDKKEPGSARLNLTLEFNYEIAPEDLQKRLIIKFKEGDYIDYQIEQRAPAHILTAVSELLTLKDIDREIELDIDKDLKPPDGQLPLFEDYEVTFKMPARKRLVVETAYPECSKEESWITVKFSTPVDVEVIKDFIQIEPEIDFYLQSRHLYIYIHADFTPGAEYILTLKKGLPAINGNKLENEFSTAAVMRELEPYFDFVTKGIFLPRRGNLRVGVETINIDKLELSIEKIFVNNLVHFLNVNPMRRRSFRRDYFGKHITRHEIEIEGDRNTKVITTVDMGNYLDTKREGIYILILRRPEHRWDRKIQWVRITDLGIIAKIGSDELFVMINSLETLAPLAGVTVKLISRTNQVLLEGVTDSEGVVRLTNYREATKGFHPFVITAEKGGDLSFLKLSDCCLPFADFDVGGSPPLKEGYEAFGYTDRGVYRPGDTVRMVAIVRDADGGIPPNFPLKVRILAPDGNIFNEYRGWVGEAGADEFNIVIPLYALTGVYSSKILVADTIEIGRVRFNVEEFMPQRIKVDVSLDKESYRSGEEAQLLVEGTMLFGPPAAGRKVKAKCKIAPKAFRASDFVDFHFGDNEKKFNRITLELGEENLDDKGAKTYRFDIPEALKPPSMLSGLLEVSVFELGGRAVTVHKRFTIHPYPRYIGLRRREKGYASKGEKVWIDYVVVKPDGKKVSECELQCSWYMVKWQSILERDKSGYYRYVSEKSLDLIEQRKVTYNGEISSVAFTPHHYGQYLVLIEDPESEVSSSINFYVSGWGYAPWAMSQPEKLFIDLDKDSYRPGEQALVQIRSPFAGKLLLTIESDRILDQRVFELKENTAKVTIPIREEFKPNVYIVGNLIRSDESEEIHAPIRAYGAYPLPIDCKDKKLEVKLTAPKKVSPHSTLDISVEVSGGTGRTYLTVAAVDEGICQITDFTTPDPFSYFYRKRRLAVQTYDIYSLILPQIEGAEEKSSPGGGRAEELARHLIPVALRRVKPVALWSGIIRTDRTGRGGIHFEVPQFQGNLRIMAVAFDEDRYGSAFKNVLVSDPIVLTPTFPRFVSGRDSFDIPVNVYNGTDKKGKIVVELSVDGPVNILSPHRQTVEVGGKEEKLIKFTCKAEDQIGALHFRLDALGLDSKTSYDVDIPLRPASPLLTEVGSGRIEDNGETSFTLSSDWIEGTTRFHLSLSPFPTVSFGHSLRFLLRYPHGCIEQTTSRVFPLLYFRDIAKVVEPTLFKDRSADYYIQEGITKLMSMQLSDGGFAYWPGGTRESEWGSIYATHFLVEARKAGYEIPNRVLSRTENHLKTFLRKRLDSRTRRYQLQRRAYAAYVLALLGKPDESSMNYLKETQLKNMSTWAQFLLAGAFALSGDVNTARSMIPFEIAPSEAPRETGQNFNSGTRENAIILEILTEIDPTHPSIPILVESISKRLKEHRYYSTQETAFGFMSLGKALKAHEAADYEGKVWWDDSLVCSFDTANKVVDLEGGEGKEVKIQIDGKGPCYYYWNFSGIRKGADIEEYDRGLSVRRIYLDQFDYKNIKQGDVILAKIAMTALTDNLDNVIVTDMLPAGFEIENPRLKSTTSIDWIRKSSITPDYMDIRDDRLNIYLNLRKGRTVEFYYMLRAVTIGKFVLPPIKAEAMYDPFKSSVANSGEVKVVPVE